MMLRIKYFVNEKRLWDVMVTVLMYDLFLYSNNNIFKSFYF